MYIKRNKKGYVFLSILLALAIILILVANYIAPDKQTGNMIKTNIDKSKDAACTVNRQQLLTQINMYVINHSGEPITPEKLMQAGYSVPTCPGRGVYSIGEKDEVYCSVHYPESSSGDLEQKSGISDKSASVEIQQKANNIIGNR